MKYFCAVLLLVVAVAQLSSGACCPCTTTCTTCLKPVLSYRVQYATEHAPVRCCSCAKCPMGYTFDGCKCVKVTARIIPYVSHC